MITVEDFDKVEMRVGTITNVSINKRARIPAYKLTIDLGSELGIKYSSAQLTTLYKEEDLIGRRVIVVTNFEPIRIGDVKSEVRVLGVETEDGCVLLKPDQEVTNGSKIY